MGSFLSTHAHGRIGENRVSRGFFVLNNSSYYFTKIFFTFKISAKTSVYHYSSFFVSNCVFSVIAYFHGD